MSTKTKTENSAGKLLVEYLAIDSLIAYENNSRTHSTEQVEQLVCSIKEFGFTNPVLVDEDNVLIAGHGRLEAAKILALSEVPAIRLAHLSDAQKKALRIADNSLALNAGWNDELLHIELDALKELDFDLGILALKDVNQTGFGSLDEYFDNSKKAPEKENKPKTMTCPHCGEEIEL